MKSPEAMTREELEEEVAFLRSELGIVVRASDIGRLREAFGMSPAEAQVALVLYNARGKTLSHSQIELAVPPKGNDREFDRIATVYICRLRSALGADAIKTVWSKGYYLTPEGIAKVDQALSERRAA